MTPQKPPETAKNQADPHAPAGDIMTVPFASAEEAWFWFIAAQGARNDGAQFSAGQALYPRPCEPSDILKILDRLYRHRRLLREHLLVMRHYGRRFLAPDPRRVKEARAWHIWREAMLRLEPVLERKGIVRRLLTNVSRPQRQISLVLEAAE